MSNEDWYRMQIASQALQGLLSSAPIQAEINVKGYAEAAVKAADALLAELKKPV